MPDSLEIRDALKQRDKEEERGERRREEGENERGEKEKNKTNICRKSLHDDISF